MKIKMNTHASGPDINAAPGQVLEVGVDVSRETAITLLNGRYAEKVEDAIETADEKAPETTAKKGKK